MHPFLTIDMDVGYALLTMRTFIQSVNYHISFHSKSEKSQTYDLFIFVLIMRTKLLSKMMILPSHSNIAWNKRMLISVYFILIDVEIRSIVVCIIVRLLNSLNWNPM